MSLNFSSLHSASPEELVEIAGNYGITADIALGRQGLIRAILQAYGQQNQVRIGHGVLEVHGEGFGFLRSATNNYLPGEGDIYVSQSQIRRFKMRTGDSVIGQVRAPKAGENFEALLRVETLNGQDPSNDPDFKPITFDQLTSVYPDDRIDLWQNPFLRAIDYVAPMGLGQRAIIQIPPRTGKHKLLRALVHTLAGEEDLQVTILLVGERPEEIHTWRAAHEVEVIATPFDETWARHLQVAEIVFERARRQVEQGENVVLVVDSLSRLLRACIAEIPSTGRDIGGVDAAALHRLRRYMGAARAIQEGGSLTIIGLVGEGATARADRVLYEDLRDVANWEVVLARDVADRGIFPPIDVRHSGTLREDLLLTPEEQTERGAWRRALTGDHLEDAAKLLERLAGGALDSSGPSGH
ncbi:MAG: transcription termination factor Rho [Deltaproteobacteria bacterium]|nr:transcription termination factor Rho [Deltaproteobacteria bacterium]